MPGRLVVFQTADDAEDTDATAEVVINELFQYVPEHRFHDAFRSFSEMELPPVAGIPLYDVLWPRFAMSFYEFTAAPKGLSHIVVLYKELAKVFTSNDIDQIECIGVEEYYLSAIADLAANEDVTLVSDRDPPRLPRIVGFLHGLWSLLLVLVDNFFSLVLKRLFDDAGRETNVVFVPQMNRFGSMESTIRAADYDYRVVAPVATLDWFRSVRVGRWDELAPYDPTPIACFVSPEVLLREFQGVVSLVTIELFGARFKRRLVDEIETEFGVRLDRAVSHSLGNTYRLHLSALPNLYLAKRMIRVTGCKSIVVGAQSLRQQTLLLAAEQEGIATFHIPHTVPIRQTPLPRTGTVQFTPGPASKEYYEEAEHIHNQASLVPMGRPLFGELADKRPTTDEHGNHEELRIVIATQHFDDDIRREYVAQIIDALETLTRPVSVVIKTHPNEKGNFYASLQADSTLDVCVASSDLYKHLKWADLTFVINSNVGIESMILGTPCVSFNEWAPRAFVRPYLENGPTPVLESEAELLSFVLDLNDPKINELREKQIAYVDENYIPSDGISRRIADYVECD